MRRFEFEDTPMADGLPTVTLGDVERAIADVSYTVAEKFNREIGEKLAYKKAEDEVWALLGYELRLKLSAQ